jgi:hypothetical protein
VPLRGVSMPYEVHLSPPSRCAERCSKRSCCWCYKRTSMCRAASPGGFQLAVQSYAILGTWHCYRRRPTLLPLVSGATDEEWNCYLKCSILLPEVRGGAT